MKTPTVVRVVDARIPTIHGTFRLVLFEDEQDGKEHLALQLGTWSEGEPVLVRIHSECFTGDVLGSLRCDCGEQLQAAMELLAREGRGLVLYLRQEGRGIGLREKLRAYNLQDEGFDTVEANLALGHEADERDYTAAAEMLRSLGVERVRLITNNPLKIESLASMGVSVVERIPAEVHLNAHNATYLQAKVHRMRHLLDLGPGVRSPVRAPSSEPLRIPGADCSDRRRPYVTLSFAQSLDGSIAAVPGEPFRLSGTESMAMTHGLRAAHDALLVGIGTVHSDDPRLTVRLVPGENPCPIVLDSHLRIAPTARLLRRPSPSDPPPLIATTNGADADRQLRLERAGAEVLRLPSDADGRVDLHALLDHLGDRGVRRVMVEGGRQVITSFLAQHLVDHLVVTFAAVLLGGLRAVGPLQPHRGDGEPSAAATVSHFPRLRNLRYRWLGDDLVLRGDPYWDR